MTKTPKPFRMTARRKAFLMAFEDLQKYFDDDGFVKQDDFSSDDIADSIMELFNKLPKRLRNINASAGLFGSALYVLQTVADLREVDTCSDNCRGAMPFEAAFFAGWSLGFDAASEDEKDETKGDAK
jgi:hypothetical protein